MTVVPEVSPVKPRIVKAPLGWACSHDGCWFMGRTPVEAYLVWRMHTVDFLHAVAYLTAQDGLTTTLSDALSDAIGAAARLRDGDVVH